MYIFKHTNDMPLESTYSEMSKALGWDKIHVDIPTTEQLEVLYENAKNKDANSFFQLMKIIRFGEAKTLNIKCGETYCGTKYERDTIVADQDEMNRLNLASKYFNETQSIFRR